MAICYLGLGSNLGDRKKNIQLAIDFLRDIDGIRIESSSALYETDPQGCPYGSPKFLNGVIKIKTTLGPEQLLMTLKSIEKKLGRKGVKQKFSPRPIDLDILFYANKKINLPNLKIPHQHLRERDFVLKPLKEIAPKVIKSLARKMKVISSIDRMRQFIAEEKAMNKTIGFVPTMGCLHQGHLSLIRQAKKDCDICVASIFVNPIQFSPEEDYKKYPRDLECDSILAKSAGCDCIFYPEVKNMYPESYLTYVNVEKITDCLCGAVRPGHFKGVTTVVAKFLNIIQPDIAYFGQKDYQQVLVIRKMAYDLNMPLKIKIMPIIRESDGLSMSSRNTYLNVRERHEAAVLYQSLSKAKKMVLAGEKNSEKIIAGIRDMIMQKNSARIDYIAVTDAGTLEPLEQVKGKALIALAVWLGKTRLIDNIIVA